jgi:hypothetical protein
MLCGASEKHLDARAHHTNLLFVHRNYELLRNKRGDGSRRRRRVLELAEDGRRGRLEHGTERWQYCSEAGEGQLLYNEGKVT